MDLLISIGLWILFGALAGWIASLVMNTDEQQNGAANVILGIVGAIVGGFIMNVLGFAGVGGFNLYSLVVAVLGAVAVIWLARVLKFS